MSVSDASWLDLASQIVDACAFLDRYADELERLRALDVVDYSSLDFPVDLRIDGENVVVQGEHFPPELVRRAGALALGLEISIYPPAGEELAPDETG